MIWEIFVSALLQKMMEIVSVILGNLHNRLFVRYIKWEQLVLNFKEEMIYSLMERNSQEMQCTQIMVV